MKNYLKITYLFLFFVTFPAAVAAQDTLFSYQEHLPREITPATGMFEMEVKLFDSAVGGTQIGATNWIAVVEVKNRAFTVWVDFGAGAFPGAERFVEVSLRTSGGGGPLTTVATRRQILSVPYAIRALRAGVADNALNLGGMEAGDFVQTADARLSDSRDPNPGSNNYIQNTTIEQSGANFNIGGGGTAGGTLSGNTVNAQTQYNLGGGRILSRAGNSLFVGGLAGLNTTAGGNSFFGSLAGRDNTIGGFNSFVGVNAGVSSLTGNQNSFFGVAAGFSNLSGSNNTAVGGGAGFSSATGNLNSYFGAGADSTNGLNNATAIGAGSFVSTSSTVVLGRNADTVQIPGNLNVTGTFTGSLPAGSANYIQNRTTQQALSNFNVSGNGTLGGTLAVNGNGTLGGSVFVGGNGSIGNTLTVGGNASIGGAVNVGTQYNIGGNQALTRTRLDLFNNAGTGHYSLEVLELPNFLVLKNNSGTTLMTVTSDGKVGIGATNPDATLEVGGTLAVQSLGSGMTSLCIDNDGVISNCSSSIRYKSNISTFQSGLALVKQLNPVTFDWKKGGMHDLGLVAEEVNKIEPLLTTTNDKGEVEGVKYDRIGVVLLNAVKEQQLQIEAQRKQIEALTKLVCLTNRRAEVCK